MAPPLTNSRCFVWNINGLQSPGRSTNAMDKMHRNGRYLILVTSIIIVTQKRLNELWIKWKTRLQRDFLISITVRHQGRDRELDKDMVLSTNIHTHEKWPEISIRNVTIALSGLGESLFVQNGFFPYGSEKGQRTRWFWSYIFRKKYAWCVYEIEFAHHHSNKPKK